MFVSLKSIAKAVVSSILVKAAAFITVWKWSTEIFRSRGAQIFLGCISFSKAIRFDLSGPLVSSS